LLSPEEITTIVLSLKVALLATLFSMPAALAIAYALARKKFWGKSLLSAMAHLPLLLPPIVTGFILLIAFGRKGFIGAPLYELTGFTFAFRWTGAALAAAVMTLPVMIPPIRIAFETINPELEESALDLGATPWQKFLTITLPLASPGILAALALGYVKSLGEFGATITFVSNIPAETQTLALAIHTLLQVPNGEAGAFRLVWFSIALAVAALLASETLAQRLRRKNR
jgi:molybdate transport system permease protein